ncbi:TPA: hypothetical protein L4Q98_004698 [Pseudomonas aeruginosa]|uniref:hypothetical protein n=1 Tax=Pseudomonas aeruginosa TaxID=287 RepID=UPI000A444FCA|nr:hypothetical protein [Pseudomonas aeruginosa]HBO3026681.1 hypothetical protein [Pseudomonas aeruginosa]
MNKANECTCPSGNGSLRHPCPAHPDSVELAGVAANLTFINGRPAMCGCQVEYSSGGGEYSDVIYVTLCAKHSGSAILDLVATNRIALTPEYEGQWHADLYLDREIPLAKAEGATPAEAVLALMSAERIDPEQGGVDQAGGDRWDALQSIMEWTAAENIPDDRKLCLIRNAARAALAQPSPKCATCGDTGQIVVSGPHYCGQFQPPEYETEPCDMCAQPSPTLPPFAEKVLAKLRRFYDCASDFESGGVDIGRHWLDLLTQLGLLNRVQRSPALWEITQQGEDLLGTPQPSPAQVECIDCHGSGFCMSISNEEIRCPCRAPIKFSDLAQAEQAEAERPEMSSERAAYFMRRFKAEEKMLGPNEQAAVDYVLSLIAQHERIVGELRDELESERITAQFHDALDECDGDRWKLRSERDAANARLHEVATACATAEQERDAALAEVERLHQFERICEGLPQDAIDGGWTVQGIRCYAKRLEDQLKSALARVAELEKQEPVGWANFRDGRFGAYLHRTEDDARRFDSTALAGKPAGSKQLALYAAPVAQAQHSVPEEVRTLLSRAQCEIEHLAECLENVCEDEEDFDVREDVADGRVVAADIAHMLAAAPGKEGV